MANPNHYNEAVGLSKKATIVKYYPERGVLRVRLNTGSSIKGSKGTEVDVSAPHSLAYNNGLFIGTLPVEGTLVVVSQGSGGAYHFVSFLSEDVANIPNLKSGTLLISSNNDTRITLDLKDNISIGSPINNIHINSDANYISTNFYNQYNFTQASRKINGTIKRDLIFNDQFSQENKLEYDDYETKFRVIGLDPSVPVTSIISGSNKNPPFIEDREITYEFQYLSSIENDLDESIRYGKSPEATISKYHSPNRRISRADTLSLSLVAPNYLIETVKGTVVDIYGNLLDLNREILPIGKGKDQVSLNNDDSKDKGKSFLLIKELQRKSLAYHFEINARKDLIGTNKAVTLPDIESNDDYARSRSRFFLDIDKEGQFKLNVPASSEKGNIPLLTRYENYSTFSKDDNGNPNQLAYPEDKRDIYHDSFAISKHKAYNDGFLTAKNNAKGSISLIKTDKSDASPKDRITQQVIKHGTAHSDILQTLFTHQSKDFLTYPTDAYLNPNPITSIKVVDKIVSDTIIVSGDDAKAGGRSGSLNFDGSIEVNFGANSIDRQSLWLDTAGGIVANIGRDINGRSVMLATGGDFLMQVGGFGVYGDSRFSKENNSLKGGVLDLRILTNGKTCHIIRCDDQGITIMSPSNISIHSSGGLSLTSDTKIKIEAPEVQIQRRTVNHVPSTSI